MSSQILSDAPDLKSSWSKLFPAYEYWLDACQRSILFLDVLRERGNVCLEHKEAAAPHVLTFETELVKDGRTLPRPVNYLLARIVPPEGTNFDKAKRPFIVVDPRAGHGPGIGGMKQDSEIGVALKAGHPCYFIGFLPEPVPGQTVEDVFMAEALFVEEVIARHSDAEDKPVIIANCQAGWQIIMMAAVRPDLAGPVMLAGSPLSYWAGVKGKNPLRYVGGMLGGAWTTALAGDIGNGLFDGASLVANFESLNPANTYWEKPYNVYAKVDTEAPRFIEFETWWGSPVLLTAGEMQWIADNLFVGNKLSSGALRTSKGLRIDLRNIRSPIIVFCSHGDDITPPQQALDWILDVYEHERDIVANGQTIVYTLHETIGHLGIFVSGKVASKEHREFTSCIDMIDMMPPGLYEAVITEVGKDTANPDLIDGKYLFALEPRTLDDIRALGGNSPEDDMRFATLARVSDINRGLYERYASPLVRVAITEPVAEAIRWMHPNRLRFAVFSDRNPAMQPIAAMAADVRRSRRPASRDNPLAVLEKLASSWIVFVLESYGSVRDATIETLFTGIYGSPILQTLVGLGEQITPADRRMERDLVREVDELRSVAQLERRFETGTPIEAALRALIYVQSAVGGFDERGFTVLTRLREAQPADKRRPLGELKELMKEQSLLIRLDEERAVDAIPDLLPESRDERTALMDAVRNIVAARGSSSGESERRLGRVEALFQSDIPRDAAETSESERRRLAH